MGLCACLYVRKSSTGRIPLASRLSSNIHRRSHRASWRGDFEVRASFCDQISEKARRQCIRVVPLTSKVLFENIVLNLKILFPVLRRERVVINTQNVVEPT